MSKEIKHPRHTPSNVGKEPLWMYAFVLLTALKNIMSTSKDIIHDLYNFIKNSIGNIIRYRENLIPNGKH